MASPSQKFSSFMKPLVISLAFGLAFCMLNPPFYWRLAKVAARRQCIPCLCDCMLEMDSMPLPGLRSSLSSGCDANRQDHAVDQKSIDLLRQELKLHETVGQQTQHHADAALLDAKKLVSQYQKEAEKCSSGMETCEVAREKSEAALAAQKEISAVWERRARELGWRDKPVLNSHSNFFDRIGLSGVAMDVKAASFFRKTKNI